VKADRADWRVCKSIFVADDEATAKRYAKSLEGPYGFYFHNLLTKRRTRGQANIYKPDLAMPDEAVNVQFILDTMVIAGDVNSVINQILKFNEQLGGFGTLLYCGHDWADPALARRSMQLMAEKVMPAVNAALRA
jgi:alkanesulfonate monooxygenase SsuD/methylene tetrahydromethanopterin reductase-like flavin-dependent oxidoreductase (luciferase family)